MDAARLRAASNGPSRGDVWGNVWGDDGRQAVATAWQRRCSWKAVRSCHAVCRFRADREEGGNPFSRRCVMASPPPCRQRKHNSHSPDPPAFGRLRTGREAPTHAEGTPRFCRWPPRCLKKSSVRFPEILRRMLPPKCQRRAPCPGPACAFRCRVCTSIAGRNLCGAPRAVWSTFAGTCRHSGRVSRADRWPLIGQSELEGRRPGAGGKVSLIGPGRSPVQDAGLSW